MLVIAYTLILLNFSPSISDATEEPEVSTTAEELDEDAVGNAPVTEEVTKPDIKLNDAAERKEFEEEPEVESDPNWDINLAIRDVAYYLRSHKFLDYDHRYYKSIDEAKYLLYQNFPRPPLRSLQWEVHRNCDDGFAKCLKYLYATVQLTSLKRTDDTITIMKENNWNLVNNSQQILSVQKECQMAQRRDNLTFIPFQGPIERFQWRTTASYYMCWYTMLEIPELSLFGESCDNHANCLDIYGANNKDPRADDSKPFACAIYSFCPDHCCPMKHIWYMKECFQSKENPCYNNNPPAKRKCILNRDNNQEFISIVGNQMNITCECHIPGYEWSSRFGLCVDINECAMGLHNCDFKAGQTCFNLPGSFECICRFGLVWNIEIGECVISQDFRNILETISDKVNNTSVYSTVEFIIKTLTKSRAGLKHYNYLLTIFSIAIVTVSC